MLKWQNELCAFDLKGWEELASLNGAVIFGLCRYLINGESGSFLMVAHYQSHRLHPTLKRAFDMARRCY